jgi:hypothetical protein
MADIHVQAKKRSSSTWLWILISIIVILTIAFILIWNNNPGVRNAINKPSQSSSVQYELPQRA